MRTVILYTAIVMISCHGYSQTTERLWEQGNLTWADFKGEPFSAGSSDSELNYQISYIAKRKKLSDSIFFLFETRNIMNQDLSWVKKGAKTADLLTYNQILFNIIELHRRRLQKDLHRIINISVAEEKFRAQNYACNKEIKRFQSETKFGTNLPAVHHWQAVIDKQLQQNPFEIIPKMKERNFGYGLNIGLGSGFFTNTLSNHFTSTFNIIFGFDVAYKNTALFLNGTLAWNKVKLGFEEKGVTWSDNLKSHVAIIDVSVGQTLFDNARSKITPFFGLGILEFTAAESGDDYADHRKLSYGLIYGLNYDYKFRTAVRLTPPPFGTYREKVENLIRFKLYTTSGNFHNMKGASVNFTIGYSIFGRLIKVED